MTRLHPDVAWTTSGRTTRWVEVGPRSVTEYFDVYWDGAFGHEVNYRNDAVMVGVTEFTEVPKLGPSVMYSRSLPFTDVSRAREYFQGNVHPELLGTEWTTDMSGLRPMSYEPFWSAIRASTPAGTSRAAPERLVAVLAELGPIDCMTFSLRLSLALEELVAILATNSSEIADDSAWLATSSWVVAGGEDAVRLFLDQPADEWRDEFGQYIGLEEIPFTAYRLVAGEPTLKSLALRSDSDAPMAKSLELRSEPDATSAEISRLLGDADPVWDTAGDLYWKWVTFRAVVTTADRLAEVLVLDGSPMSEADGERQRRIEEFLGQQHGRVADGLIELFDTHLTRPRGMNTAMFVIERRGKTTLDDYLARYSLERIP